MLFCSCPSSDPIRFFRPLLRPALAFNGVDSIRRVSVSQRVSPQVEAGTGQQDLQEVERVRMVFPETWLWTNLSAGYSCLLSQTPLRGLYLNCKHYMHHFLGDEKYCQQLLFCSSCGFLCPAFSLLSSGIFTDMHACCYKFTGHTRKLHRSHEEPVMATDLCTT